MIELVDVQYGDYVYINSTAPGIDSDNHGFFVVGWGEIQNCEDAIQSTLSLGTNIFADKNSAYVNSIPYVVDFPGSRKDSIATIRRQSPVPRPFYCSYYNAPGPDDFFLSGHSWFFVTMPSEITLPVERLFALP